VVERGRTEELIERRRWRGLLWLPLVASLCAMMVAVVWFSLVLYREERSAAPPRHPQQSPSAAPTHAPSRAAAPQAALAPTSALPPTATVQAAPPSKHRRQLKRPTPRTDPDRTFMSMVSQIPGITITNAAIARQMAVMVAR
jgi:hypothetical protein